MIIFGNIGVIFSKCIMGYILTQKTLETNVSTILVQVKTYA